MASDETIQRMIDKFDEKLDKLADGQSDIRERVTRVEGKFDTFEERQENHYEQNQREHNDMVSLFSGYKERTDEEIKDLRDGHAGQQSVLDVRKGERQVLGRGWELLIALIAGGVLLAVGGWLAKIIGIFDG